MFNTAKEGLNDIAITSGNFYIRIKKLKQNICIYYIFNYEFESILEYRFGNREARSDFHVP